VIRWVYQEGLDINVENKSGFTPLDALRSNALQHSSGIDQPIVWHYMMTPGIMKKDNWMRGRDARNGSSDKVPVNEKW